MPDPIDPPNTEETKKDTPKESDSSKTSDDKDRTTEQFDKLTNSNKDLKLDNEEKDKELEKYKKLFSNYETPTKETPDAKQYPNLNQQQVNDAFGGMVDKDGYLDGNKLVGVLQAMNQNNQEANLRAERAEKSVQDTNKNFRKQQETAAQIKVYDKYPQLNPDNKDKFDPKMWRAVYNELAVKAKAGENPSDSDYIEAADSVYNDFYKDKDMNKQDQAKLDEKNDQKTESTVSRPRSTTHKSYFTGTEEDELRNQVRHGKKGALAELLRRKEEAHKKNQQQ